MTNLKSDLPVIALDSAKRQLQALCPSGHHEVIDASAPESVSSEETFYPGQIVRVVSMGAAGYMVLGDGPATNEDIYLPADNPEYFIIHTEGKLTFHTAIADITVMK
jgi:hypothetical protein